jgi:hypothetical protein
MLEELGTAREKEAVIVNIAKARGAVRARFLAVGVFLSMLAVSSKQVVDTMKKVWKLRGNLEFCPLEGRRFVLEFAEEGDFTHVTKGGPWRFRADAVLVEALKEGDDPATVTITSVPIWVQLKDIPFYLLSKELARNLGKKIGSLITIDNNARGDIFDKILRAKVRIDINQPLMRWTPILDGVTNEEVIVSIFYERLPSFCLRCGIIGHGEGSCSTPANQQTRSYNKDLGVPPTLAEDERRWFLPGYTGQARHQQSPALPWRLPAAANPSAANTSTRQQAIVADVAINVAKLSVQDPNPVKKTNEELLKDGIGSPTASVASSHLPSKEAVEDAEEPAIIITLPPSKRKQWKRKVRANDGSQSKLTDTLTTRQTVLGAPREREEEDDPSLCPPAKRTIMQVPSLEECLGKEVLYQLRKEDKGEIGLGVVDADANVLIRSESVYGVSLVGLAESVPGKVVIGQAGVEEQVTESRKNIVEEQNLQLENTVEKGQGEDELEKGDADGRPAGIEPGTEEGAWQAQ